jgi:hypothetical protein
VVNLGAGYQVRPWLQVIAQVTNLFDRRYYTAGLLGPFGFTDSGAFIARPFPPIGGEFPVRQTIVLLTGGAGEVLGWDAVQVLTGLVELRANESQLVIDGLGIGD